MYNFCIQKNQFNLLQRSSFVLDALIVIDLYNNDKSFMNVFYILEFFDWILELLIFVK